MMPNGNFIQMKDYLSSYTPQWGLRFYNFEDKAYFLENIYQLIPTQDKIAKALSVEKSSFDI